MFRLNWYDLSQLLLLINTRQNFFIWYALLVDLLIRVVNFVYHLINSRNFFLRSFIAFI